MQASKDQVEAEIRERTRHRQVLLDIQAVLATKSGKNFIRYLFESFEVMEAPPVGLTGEFLMDRLGFLRAGNSIYKIVAEASPDVVGAIIGQIEREKNEQADYLETRRT